MNSLTYILVFGILANVSTMANGDSNIETTTWAPTDNSEEDEGPPGFFPHTLQDNNRNGFDQLIQFIPTINSTLTKLRDKLNDLGNNIETMKSQIEDSKRNQEGVNELLSNLSSKLDGLKRTQNKIQSSISSQAETMSSFQSKNSKMMYALFKQFPEALIDLLPPPKNGDSFNGSTFEGISTRDPADYDLVAQIKNYLDTDLTGYQLYLPHGFVSAPAPNNISAKTAEVATFAHDVEGESGAQPEMSYHIGGTNISLHLYFTNGGDFRTFAAALLPRTAPASSILSLDCTAYKHRGTVGSHKCVTNVDEDTTRTLTVYEGNIYLKVTFSANSSPRPATLTCEVFKLEI